MDTHPSIRVQFVSLWALGGTAQVDEGEKGLGEISVLTPDFVTLLLVGINTLLISVISHLGTKHIDGTLLPISCRIHQDRTGMLGND